MALSGRQEEAAGLVAADLLDDAAICERVGIRSRQTLHNWRQVPEFAARVEALRAEYRARIRSHGLAVRENRIRALNERYQLLEQVREARSEAYAREPGGSTGLIAVVTITKHGDEVFGLDHGMLREQRELAKHIAIETGEWQEKTEVRHVGKVSITSIRAVQPAVRDAASGDADD